MSKSVSKSSSGKPPSTMLEAVIDSLHSASSHQPGVDEKPAALLWADPRGEWRPLVPLLRERLPQLLTLGDYDPATRTGPAIWLKCVIARLIDEVPIAADVVPVIYMPEISRQDLRAGDECPVLLRPLVELQYRGAVWTQKNGRDWSIEAFLVSENSLGLDVFRDASTRRSMDASLMVLAETPISQLKGKKLEAEDFDRLVVGDHPRELLTWMNSPSDVQKRFQEVGKWHAFRNRCRNDFGFDPESDGETVAAESFGLRNSDTWSALWERFCESPALYPNIPELLIRSKPSGGKLLFDREAWPDENDTAEQSLRQKLESLQSVSAADARSAIRKLEAEHGPRRNWVWAQLGRSPLATALLHLVQLAERTESYLGGDSPEHIANLYSEFGYLADEAALRALACLGNNAQRNAVRTTVRALYLPWLEHAAERLQKLVASNPLPTLVQQPKIEADRGACLLFADGLRFDLARLLSARLEQRSLKTSFRFRWSALPCVTATAKPAVSPIAHRLTGKDIPSDYAPIIKDTDEELTHARFQKLLKESEYQIVGSEENSGPTKATNRGWTEFGTIDRRGHDMQIELAGQLEGEIERLVERIITLLEAGWKSVRVVTDHGWLLMPGNLPKQELPHYLTESKWSRCARIKGDSQLSVPTASWTWNPSAEFACAPGISVFSQGYAYSHGGISLQECLIPDLLVEPSENGSSVKVTISDIQWRGQRVRLQVDPTDSSLRVDLRTSPNSTASSIAVEVCEPESDGKASLLVENEDLAGSAAVVVVLDARGRIVGKQSTIVGGEES